MKILIDRLSGMNPKKGTSILNATEAQLATDCILWGGELRSIVQPLDIITLTKTGIIRSIYRLGSLWLHWVTSVDVVKSPIASDSFDRYYFTGDKTPKVINETLAQAGSGTNYPTDFYQLGVPGPINAASLVVTGGSAGSEARSYLYTYVTQWGEEGTPSPAVSATGFTDATSWDLSAMDVAPLNSGGISGAVHASGIVTVTCTANHLLRTGEYVTNSSVGGMTDLNAEFKVTRISATRFSVILSTGQTYTSGGTWVREANLNITGMVKRIYRTVSGVYKFVAEIGVATTTYVDSLANSAVGESISSTNYDMPHSEMQGIIAMPNGIQVGFVDNQLCFSEPYLPHAWPIIYRINTDHNIVAIATWAYSVIVGTEEYPYKVTGVNPAAMSKSKIERNQACVSKESMKALNSGVAYASPDGVMYISSSSAILATNDLMKKKEWDVYSPNSLRAEIYDNRYYAWYENGGAENATDAGIVYDPEEPQAQLVQLSSSATAVWTDRLTDTMYIVEGSVVKQWEAGANDYTSFWRSKEFYLPREAVMRACQVHIELQDAISESDYNAAVAAAVKSIDDSYTNATFFEDGSLGGAQIGEYPLAGGPYVNILSSFNTPVTITVSIYKEGSLLQNKQISTSNAFRVKGTGLGGHWSIAVSSAKTLVKKITLAETMSELGEI